MKSKVLFFCCLALLLGTDSFAEVSIEDHRHKSSLTILIFGDSGTGERQQYEVGQAMYEKCLAEVCDFAVGLGDNLYHASDDSEMSFAEHIKQKFELPYQQFNNFKREVDGSAGLDFWMVLGNHDYEGSEHAQLNQQKFSGLWRMPSTYYEIPKLPSWINIFAIDSEKLNSTQQKDLEQYFCNTERSGWKFALGHHPMFPLSLKKRERSLQKYFVDPIIKAEECTPHAYFAGHEHSQTHQSHRKLLVEEFVQGAAARLVNRFRRNQFNDNTITRVKELKYGFAILKIDPSSFYIRYFDQNGKEFYSWSKTKDQWALD